MGYLDFIIATPYSWITLAAVFVGGALSRLTAPVEGESGVERARSWKWASVFIFLACAVVAATLAVFIPEARLIRDVGLVYQFGATVLVSGLALRFKLVVGTLVFLVIVAAAVATVLVQQIWTRYAPPETVATIRVLSVPEDGETVQTALEIVPGDDPEAAVNDSVVVQVPGARFSVRVQTVALSPHYFFAGMAHGFRLVAINGIDETTAHRFAEPGGAANRLAEFLLARAGPRAGVTIREIESEAVRSVVLRRYSVRLDAAGVPRIEESR
jgi:hypothetical protein